MTQSEYDQKKRECWEEFLQKHEISTADGVTADAFIMAFDRAYALGRQEKDADTVISGWVCRDKVCNKPFTSDLFFVLEKPTRVLEWGKWSDCGDYIELDSNLFPDLTWESDPQEVEIIIKRKKNGY